MLEDRAARGIAGRPGGPVRLYFGCRSEAEFLMRDRLLAWRGEGVLDSVTVALSRQTPAKAYVQDALTPRPARCSTFSERAGAHVMVCGDARMASDVGDTLLQILQREEGSATSTRRAACASSATAAATWRTSGACSSTATWHWPRSYRDRYDQGAGWLTRLTRKLGTGRPSSSAICRY